MKWKLVIMLYLITLITTHISTEDNFKGNNNKGKLRKLIRKPRATKMDGGFLGPIFEVIRIKSEQKDDTEYTLGMVYNVLADSFLDTYIPTTAKTPLLNDDMNDNVTTSTSTTTEKYRVSRKEFGRILGRNYLGLKRLFDIELEDAKNQSQYSIAELKAYEASQNQKVVVLP